MDKNPSEVRFFYYEKQSLFNHGRIINQKRSTKTYRKQNIKAVSATSLTHESISPFLVNHILIPSNTLAEMVSSQQKRKH